MNTADQYVEAIYLEQQIENGPVSTGVLADRLDISPASANDMIGKLETRGLIDHEKYTGVTLTDKGIARAREALETYCIIERFLTNILAVESFQTEADELEPVIDELVAERLDTIIDRHPDCPDCFDPETDACCYLDIATELSDTNEQRAD
ncbi:metal-dependent transcriptional regulator [Haloquadratum walsbyi]|jgi:Mn-dependent DtxR family transcriptional regulator|uniref:SirR/DtxR family transcription regulator n=1 Tax=Haloquadratum walsbyi (strain DSM 16790 / HBSQ001) TaxID=362976 RepID=Q18JG8_HALWD|nr:metal-dependent transcriptional regulator [Haloquadratum walsbyi]CAJ51838.1 SirR/DtxR family transcription regulator [Haloquadratum walsbyi DSM 16790]